MICVAEKLSITVFSGSIDRLTGMTILASAATAMDMEVEIFLQLWGAYAFKKDIIKKNMNFSEFRDLAGEVAKRLQELNLPMWYDLLKEAKNLGKTQNLCMFNSMQNMERLKRRP
jgi:peroxiredoxin family protein